MKLSERLAKSAEGQSAAAQPAAQPAAATAPASRRTPRAPAGEPRPSGTSGKAARKVPARTAARTPAAGAGPAGGALPPLERRKGGRRAGEAAIEITDLEGLRSAVRAAVVAELGPSLGGAAVNEALVRSLVEQHLDEASRSSRVTVGPAERADFLQTTLADMLGWGPLTSLMADPTVTEIMVNALDSVWVERQGKLERTGVRFSTLQSYRTVIDRMLAVAGRRVDEAQPMADGRLPDGSRVNVIIPPLVVGDPVLTVRRFPEIAFTTADLVSRGSLSAAAADFLDLCIRGKLNVLVSGGTGTGKTTLLNVLSASIPDDERVITIEDAAELRLGQPHVVSLEARTANIEGIGTVAIRDLVRNALRMRPDRIVVGEVRGGEALDMLQAMNTGHEGSLTTVHANSPRDALARIETMVLMSGIELPLRAIREQVASAIDIVVQLSRQNDGSRVISQVTEIQGREGDTITMQDVYLRKNGPLASTGLRPRCASRIEDRGLPVAAGLFRAAPASSTGLSRRKR